MASPYNNGYNNGYDNGYNSNSYTPNPMQRAPSPYHNPYGPDPNQRAPSPYQHGASNSYYDQHPQGGGPAYTPSEPSPQMEMPAAGEGERGLLGAIGGGLTGGFIGKQTSHGILGTVGGAIVGSLTEDWAKKKRPIPGRPVTPTGLGNERPPSPAPQNNRPPAYNAGYVDTQTTVATSTQVHPGYWQAGPPPGPQMKACGHTHACACSFFGKR